MSYPSVLGLHGVAGAGKDTAFERLVALGGERFVRFSIADPMKESIAALFNCTIEDLEAAKRDPNSVVQFGHYNRRDIDLGTHVFTSVGPDLSMREFMQRYGTEAHRDIFGEDFWLRHWLRQVEHLRYGPNADIHNRPTIVNTSVRFPNEAEAILAQPSGEIWQIVGPQDDGAAGHESERPLPPGLVTRYIDNSVRETLKYRTFDDPNERDLAPIYDYLDDQIALVLDEWKRS